MLYTQSTSACSERQLRFYQPCSVVTSDKKQKCGCGGKIAISQNSCWLAVSQDSGLNTPAFAESTTGSLITSAWGFVVLMFHPKKTSPTTQDPRTPAGVLDMHGRVPSTTFPSVPWKYLSQSTSTMLDLT